MLARSLTTSPYHLFLEVYRASSKARNCKPPSSYIQIDGFTKQTYTYSDLITMSERLAAGLQIDGVKPGDIVCILAPNHIDYHVVFYAVALINATLQAINPMFTKGTSILWYNFGNMIHYHLQDPDCETVHD